MKLKDFKKLNEGWDRWRLTEGKLQYSVSNTGYGDVYEFFDENGEETEQTLGMMVLDLADAGVGGWASDFLKITRSRGNRSSPLCLFRPG